MKDKWKRVLYICKVVIKGGLQTFLYLLSDTLKSLRSERWKYRYWRKKHEKRLKETVPVNVQPYFSIVLTGSGDLNVTMHSLEKVNYVNQEVLDEDQTSWKTVLSKARGDYICILCRGDQLAENALQKLALAINKDYNKNKLLFYSDEDRITDQGDRHLPFFKPDYSLDTLRSFFYIGGFFVLKKELARMLTRNLDLPVLYGGYLLALEASFLIQKEQVCHIPEIMYHRQEDAPKPDAVQMGRDKERLFRQYGIAVKTEKVKDCNEVRVLYELEERPRISIIIPSKDNPDFLEKCLNSVQAYTRYENYEIVVVDNGSNEENKARYDQICRQQNVSCAYYYEPMDFNFSKMCNMGARKALGDFYLFLNDDIEIRKIEGYDWLERMLGQAMQKITGAVGAKLLYPSSNKIQHVGIVNYESRISHLLRECGDSKPMLFGRNRFDYNCSMVTGACLMINKEKYWQVNGFSEELAVAFNDVELCLKLLEEGYYNVVRNDVVLYHHESVTRGTDVIDPKKHLRNLREKERVFELHPSFVKKDAFYSRHLTQRSLDGTINTEYRPDSFDTFLDSNKIGIVNESEFSIDGTIEYAGQENGQVCIRGYAFSANIRYNNLNKIYVVLKGSSETRYVRTQKVFNHTISEQKEVSRNLNFVEFYTVFPITQLKDGKYQIGVVLKPFAKSRAYLHMMDKTMEIGAKMQKG